MEADAEHAFLAWAAGRVTRLHSTAYLLCGDWHAAEDLVQEALARTALHWRKVSSADNPDAYVRRILLNEARQNWRRRTRRPAIAALDFEVPVDDGAQIRADRDELLQALRRLPSRQRTAVVLRYFEQLSESETASAMGCSVGTVKSQTSRAVEALRRTITTQEPSC